MAEQADPNVNHRPAVADLRRTVDELTRRVSRINGRPRHMSHRLFEDDDDLTTTVRAGAARARETVGQHPGLAALGLAAAAGAVIAIAMYSKERQRSSRFWWD
ncbi:hypothetical protein [Hansschlegelia beijingensis]|uniref:ElaB/YqjD/DUF883 family membrane-anchored ribosome-binding protein n=1 Tax=Hansschlegelia beijingensis TaxID=1133344 RepID=A0A7W6GGD7_9HYPH|nr:hypothetical protein [Hansschlegelia beijingensis]MBB3972619.1 ElaB/YqjD/DUF883 family membrane-anchored ribosome-binding protein [Hansschlegelia beijingensis]